jgi:hypothetical protein
MSRLLALLIALAVATALPVAAQEKPSAPSVIYAVVFGVLFDEQGNVKQLRLLKVLEPRKGNAEATGVEIPEAYVESVHKLLSSPRYRPSPEMVKPEEVFTYFFYDPNQPTRADLDPRPRRN